MILRLVPPIDHFRRLWDLGYRNLVPIVPPDAELSKTSQLYRRLKTGQDSRGKAPGVLGADGLWSGFPNWQKHVASEEDLGRWAAWGAGVGIKTGVDGTGMVDVDTRNLGLARTIATAIEERIGVCPTRFGEYPKAGFIIMFSEPTPYKRLDFKNPETGAVERIEILNGGRQFVAEGMHPSGTAYRWLVPLVQHDQLVIATPDQLTGLLEHLRGILPEASQVVTERLAGEGGPIRQELLLGDPALVRRALKAMPNTSENFPTRDSFVEVGFALKAALADEAEALDLYQEWAAEWEGDENGKNDPGFVEDVFHSLKRPFRIGADRLFELAEKLTPGEGHRIRSAPYWSEPGLSEGLGLFPQTQKARERELPELESFDQADDSALDLSAEPLIDGLLDQEAMTVLYGESNTGKSFVALDIAYHIATGRDWAGRRVARMGVVYVVAEGGKGTRKRVRALRLRFGKANVPLAFLMVPVDLLHADADTGPLIKRIRQFAANLPQPLKVGLIVIDTLSRVLAGGEENRSADMGAIVANFDRIRRATGAHLLVVHHSGKDPAKGARGHSLLRAATDTEIEIANWQIMATKQRDLEGTFATGFELESVVIGERIDGRPVTSATVRLVTRNTIVTGVAVGRERDVLDALQTLWGRWPIAERSAGIPTGAIVDRLGGIKANTVRAYLSRLVVKNLVITISQGHWRPAVTDILD